MIFVWGEKEYGKVYQVPGVCYVSSIFFHAFFFPLFPYRSYIVVTGASPEIDDAIERGTIRQSTYGFWGVRIPMSFRSVFFGYVRGLIGLVVVWMAIVAGVSLVADDWPGKKGSGNLDLIMYGIGVGGVVLFVLTRWLTRASESKSAELLATLGLLVLPLAEQDAEPLS